MLAALFLMACDQPEAPGENFTYDGSVRVLEPANGAVVEPTFSVFFSAGEDVAEVRLDVDGYPYMSATPVEELDGELVVTLEVGGHALSLVGFDAQGEALSHHDLSIQVAEEGGTWIGFVSPTDGDTLNNPVTFVVNGSDDIDAIELFADGWSLGKLAPGGTLTYTFTGTGYARTIDAVGYAGTDSVAEDSITITVDPGSNPDPSDFNDLIVSILQTYPTDGTNEYYWPSDSDWYGTTRDIYYLGERVAEGDDQGRCYCVGLTWEVFMRAFDEADAMTGGDGSLNGMSVDDLTEFRIDWFVRDLWGDGVVTAAMNYGLGDEVNGVANLKQGDILQFWRNSGSGHSVIFDDWEYDGGGNIIGIRYWSTQSSTDGIDYNSEYFGGDSSDIDPRYFFAARFRMPTDWTPWL